MSVFLCRNSPQKPAGMTVCACPEGVCRHACQCGQLGDDCPGKRCPMHRDYLAPCSVPPATQQEELRALRLWHAGELVKGRDLAQRAASGAQSAAYNATANFHMRAVQTLNAYFPASDYVELGAIK